MSERVPPVQRVLELFRVDAPGGQPFGRFEAGALIVTALGLAFMYFVGQESTFLSLFGDTLAAAVSDDNPAKLFARHPAALHPNYQLYSLLFWVGSCLAGYAVLPALYIKLSGNSVRSFCNLSFSGLTKHAPVYFTLFIIFVLPLLWASTWPENKHLYPFYKQSGRSWADLLVWELAYGMQFFALEFFFRGFMLETMRKWMGWGVVFVVAVPYCMLHFQKTPVESVAAIFAGILLGSLAMKYRSIWGGVALHWGVAVTMDVSSLIQQGQLPTQWWP